MRVQVRSLSELRHDPTFRSALWNLLAPSYDDPTALLNRALIHSDTVYTALDDDNSLLAFSMAAHELVVPIVGRKPVTAVYTGLSATRHQHKQSGAMRALWGRWLADAKAQQKESGTNLLIWGTTANPLVYLYISKIQPEAEPHGDGSFSPEALPIAQALRKRLGLQASSPDEHPSVLKGLAQSTRYSELESARIRQTCADTGFMLFDKLGIVEAAGDRLLFFGQCPSAAG